MKEIHRFENNISNSLIDHLIWFKESVKDGSGDNMLMCTSFENCGLGWN